MQLTPEIKKQLEAQKKQCLFCKLISGEMEAKKVFEDKLSTAMLDINPALKGHTLFLLKEHYPIMPYIPPNEFKHYFGLIPRLSQALKDGMVRTGINVFIANGAVAGQQSPHFLLHLLPRENGDGFFNFLFSRKSIELKGEEKKILAHNFPQLMSNHFQRNPAVWHQGSGEELAVEGMALYEDEKVKVVLAKKSATPGHLEIYSKQEEKYIEKLSEEDSAHLFYTASCAASLVFEGLKAQGTNIILKSGNSDDNPEGKLVVHVLPRKEGDGLDLLWKPKPAGYDLDSVQSRIKDKTWKINYPKKEGKQVEKKTERIKAAETMNIAQEDEIRKAIEVVKES